MEKDARNTALPISRYADPGGIRAALQRAKRANIEGRAYQVEVVIERNGFGGDSEWHPGFSIAALRTRKV